MKRWIWPAIAIVALTTAGVTLIALPRTPVWTTASPEAFSEYEAGDEAFNKIYLEEARAHFERALDLDPDFLIAKLRVAQLLQGGNPEKADQLLRELIEADLSGLTPRERFFIEYRIALRNRASDEAARLLDQCIEEYPNDPSIIAAKAKEAWQQGNLKKAEQLYEHLLNIDPNWVVAYNALGYIKMMQGRFVGAEESFKSYRYIAPDQANPHDSLGELFITTGRYEEARASLERAIEMKPDFWASYVHLSILMALIGDIDAHQNLIDRARNAEIPDENIVEMECRARYAELADRNAWQEILNERLSDCFAEFNSMFAAIVTHRAACRIGDWELAGSIEDKAMDILKSAKESGSESESTVLQATTLHMQGVRLAVEGEFESAVFLFRETDDQLGFMTVDRGMFKLFNQLVLAETLFAAGKDADAHELLAAIRRINPPIVQEFEDSGFRILGIASRLTPETKTSPEAVEPRRAQISL